MRYSETRKGIDRAGFDEVIEGMTGLEDGTGGVAFEWALNVLDLALGRDLDIEEDIVRKDLQEEWEKAQVKDEKELAATLAELASL